MIVGPSPYFRQHHAVDDPQIDALAFREWFRVRPRLEQLAFERAISIPEYHAALIFRRLAEIVLAGEWPRTPWLGETTGGGRAQFDVAIPRYTEALNRLNDIRRELGPFGFDLLEAHLVKDWSWRRLGARLRRDPKTVRAWTIVALRALAVVMWA